MLFGVGIVTDIMSTLTEVVTGALALVVSATSGVVAIFHTAEGFTLYGVFALIGLGLMFVTLGINFIKGFIQKRG